jgi:hypothetical protein
MSTPDEDAEKLKLGPTGCAPDGTLGPHDHGEIRTAVYAQDGKVILNFGKDLRWIGLTPEQALQLGVVLFGLARDLGARPPLDPAGPTH